MNTDAHGNGNMTTMPHPNNAWSLSYDGEKRLTVIEKGTPADGDLKIEFAYDCMGRRIRKEVSAYSAALGVYQLQSDTKFVYDGWNVIAELDATSSNAVTRTFVWGLDLSQSLQGAGGVGGLVAVTEHGMTTNDHYAAYDASRAQRDGRCVRSACRSETSGERQLAGNVSEYLDSSGNVVAHDEYSPFGELTAATGSKAGDFPHRFSTKYFDELVTSSTTQALYYYGHRYYLPELGRWLSRDPAEELGGINRLAFCSNAPVSNVDSLGLWKRVGGSTSTIYEAESDTDRLQDLATRVSGDWRNWVCIWPVPRGDTWTSSRYPTANKKCARANVANLLSPFGKSVAMGAKPNGDTYPTKAASIVSTDYSWTTPMGAAQYLARVSGRGATPIHRLYLVGHGRADSPYLGRQDTRALHFGAEHVLRAAAPESNNGDNSYNSAKNRIGPPKCWFTTGAKVYGVGCHTGHSWARSWAGTIMRSGSTVYGAEHYIIVPRWNFGFHPYLRMQERRLGWLYRRNYGPKAYARGGIKHLPWQAFGGTE